MWDLLGEVVTCGGLGLPMASSHLSFRRNTPWLLLEMLGSQKSDAGIDRHILQAVAAQPTFLTGREN